jgi:phosphopantetheinyl transferase (holo-ACP synthase)
MLSKCVTRKREIEFLGGRLAGKLAASAWRRLSGRSWLDWNFLDIHADIDGTRICEHDDGASHPISISHTRAVAVALVSPVNVFVGIDLEGPDSHVRQTNDLFHEIELKQIDSSTEARLRWTIKEAFGKLTGKGIFGYARSLITTNCFDRLWLLVRHDIAPDGELVLAAGHLGDLAMSMAFLTKD